MSKQETDSLLSLWRNWQIDAAEFVRFFEEWSQLFESEKREHFDEWPKWSRDCHRFRAETECLVAKLASVFRSVGISAQPIFDFLSALDDQFDKPPEFRDAFPVGGSYSLVIEKHRAESVLKAVLAIPPAPDPQAHAEMASNGDKGDAEWPIQAEAARTIGVNPGQISRAISEGDLDTNGLKGRDCRIDPVSLWQWQKARLQRAADQAESNERVEAQIAKHRGR
jgi:hypothetical protein